MKHLLTSLGITLSILFLTRPATAWESIPKPPAASPLAWVTTDPEMKETLWAASTHELFHADSASSPFSGWRDAGVITGTQKIKRLLAHTSREVFILTDKAVFLWSKPYPLQRVFERSSEAGTSLLAFTAAAWPQPVWFAGTSEGLFISQDQGKTWSPHLSLGHGQPVSFLASADSSVFIRLKNTLYRAQSLENAEAVFRFAESEPNLETESDPESEESLASPTPLFEPVFLASADSQQLWLTSPQGIAESTDNGRQWALLSLSGLADLPVRALAYSEKNRLLFAAAGSRVYVYRKSDQRWYALPQNFQGSILALSVRPGSPENLIAASNNGLMTQPILPERLFPAGQNLIPPEYESLFHKKIAGEPSPQAVQQAVVRYGNLTNAKIRRWHKESRLSALLPSLSFGRDFSSGNTLDLDRGGTADPDRYIAGPDDVNEGWSADVSWDLADFIWGSAQTSIDIREKLMVDQRRDFLAEAMRIYFERRRLQAELFFSNSGEVRTLYEKQLRYEELTALLDALTGGWFSEQLKKAAASV